MIWTAIKTFVVGNALWFYLAAAAAIFAAGAYSGYQVENTRHLAALALQKQEAEKAANTLADKLEATVGQLSRSKAALAKKQAEQKVKVENEIKSNPAYKCPLPDAAVQLLNQ